MFSNYFPGSLFGSNSNMLLNVKVEDGHFPKEDKFLVFQCIEDMRKGKANVEDLHRIIQKYGKEALEQAVNIENITGPEIQSVFGPVTRTFKGNNLSPLHYAYLTGREDAFKLLLAEGADIDEKFFFQCTSMIPERNEESKTTDTLFSQLQKHNQGGVDDDFRTRNVRCAFFISLLQRKRLDDVLKMMLGTIKTMHEARLRRLEKHGVDWKNHFFLEHNVSSLFPFVPSIAYIKQSLGQMDESYRGMLDSLVSVLQKTRADAHNKEDLFFRCNDKEASPVLDGIDILIPCFVELCNSLHADMTNDQYREWCVITILETDKNYDRNKKKEQYAGSIRTRLNHACYWIDKDDDDLEENPDKLLQTIVSMSSKMVKENDSELYREALLDFVKDQVSGYAKRFDDAGLQKLADHLSHISLPVRADELLMELKSAAEEVENFHYEPPRSHSFGM